MRILRTVAELRGHVAEARRAGRTVGLVPTMGALHPGHLSLIATARRSCPETIVSVFVNPRQFDDAGDLLAYPRDEDADAAAADAAGATALFVPRPEEVYPDGFATEVRVGGPLVERLEGAHRGAAHFHGVTTVVAKLLGMAQPDVAYFGAKDAQQALVVGRLVRDLDLPVRLAIGATVREPDGLARSSRNVHLGAADRVRAAAVPRALRAAVAALHAGERDAETLRARVRGVLSEAGLAAEYVAVADPGRLGERDRVERPSLLAVAVPLGPVRLIDNVLLDPTTAPGGDGLPSSAGLIADPSPAPSYVADPPPVAARTGPHPDLARTLQEA